MTRYAVLLRGINVGGRTKLRMAELRVLLADLGLTDVATYLQSGNAVVTSGESPDAVAARIRASIHDATGMTVPCLVRTGAQLRTVIDAHPLADVADVGSRMIAVFLSADLDPAHDPRPLAPEEIRLGSRVVYQWCPNGVSKHPNVTAFVEKQHGVTATARNWNTVTALDAMLAP